MTTSWLDLVPALPAVGLAFEPWFKGRDALVALLEPFFSARTAAGQTFLFYEFGPLGLRVQTSAGYVYQFDLVQIVVAFHGDDQAEAPHYSKALAALVEEAADLFKHLLPGQRPLTRVGVTASAEVPRDAVPPGIRAWLGRLAAPAELESVQARFAAKVATGEGTVDRVLHRFKQGAGPARPLEVEFDWQRYHEPPPEVRGKDVGKRLEEHAEAALRYFETFAAGGSPDA